MPRVASPIESKNSDSCCALSVTLYAFTEVVILELLGIFDEASVHGFRVLANAEFRKLFIACVDRHSVPYSCDILVANLMSSVLMLTFSHLQP